MLLNKLIWTSHEQGAFAKKVPWLYEYLPLIVLFFLAACSTAPVTRDFYPIGIYSIPGTNALPVVQAAGFNLVTASADGPSLDQIAAFGMKALVNPGSFAGPDFQPGTVRSNVMAFDKHPAVWAWYIIDEPDLNEISPDDVKIAQQTVKRTGALKPTALVIYQGGLARYYANIADITMIDRYPIPWLPLANVGQHVELTRLALGKEKPLIAIIQTHDWSLYPDQMPGENNLRPPTFEELRCMTYSALAEGATGLFYYSFDDSRWKITEHPQNWKDLKKVVSEVRERVPLFTAKHVWRPYDEDYRDRTIRFNAALQSAVTSAFLVVKKGNQKVPEGEYILAVNSTDKRQDYLFRPWASVGGIVPVLFENRVLTVTNRWAKDHFEPFNSFNRVAIGIRKPDRTFPIVCLVHDFKDQDIDSSVQSDFRHILFRRDRARKETFVDLLPIQIDFRLIVAAHEHLEIALLDFRSYVTDRIGDTQRCVMTHDSVEIDHVVLRSHFLLFQHAADSGCHVAGLRPKPAFTRDLLPIQSVGPVLT